MSIQAKIRNKYLNWRRRRAKQEIPYPLPRLKKVHRDITDPYPGPNPRTLVDKHVDVTWVRHADMLYMHKNGVKQESGHISVEQAKQAGWPEGD